MTENDQRAMLIYAGGLAHGALLRVRQLLADNRTNEARIVADQNIELIHRTLSSDEAIKHGDPYHVQSTAN
jgi:sulfur carrier protein ThiS